jgi:hypothetical protein
MSLLIALAVPFYVTVWHSQTPVIQKKVQKTDHFNCESDFHVV